MSEVKQCHRDAAQECFWAFNDWVAKLLRFSNVPTRQELETIAAQIIADCCPAQGEGLQIQGEHTPTPWYILEIPGQVKFFIAAKPTEDHPYFGHTRNIDICGDEEYPRKRADAELIVKAVNAYCALPAPPAQEEK